MKSESFKKFKSLKKNEKLLFIILISLISLVTIWILQKPEKSVDSNENQDLGISIPQGQLIIPIELANGKAISSLITQYGVVDLFIEPQHKILAKNLKILKLNAEDQSFGALVPEKKSEFLQSVFAQKNLVAAIKNNHSAQAEFFIYRSAKLKSSLLNIPVED